MLDQLLIKQGERFGHAWAWAHEKRIEIGTTPLPKSGWTVESRVKRLFRHELSHIIIAWYDNKYFNEEEAHQFFKEVSLE